MSSSTTSVATCSANVIQQWTIAGEAKGSPLALPSGGSKASVTRMIWGKGGGFPMCVTLSNGAIATYSASGELLESRVSNSESGAGEHILSAALSTAGSIVCTGGHDQTVKLWDMNKGSEPTAVFGGHTSAITCCSIDSKDEHVISGSHDGHILVHSVSSSASSSLEAAKDSAVRSVQFSPFKRGIAASGGEDAVLHLWDTAKGEKVTKFAQHKACIKGLAFSPVNELLLCSAGLDKMLLFYDVQANKLVKSMTCEEALHSLDFMNDGFTVAAGTAGGKVLVYDLRTLGSGGSPKSTFTASKHSPIIDVQFRHAPKASAGAAKPKPRVAGKENTVPEAKDRDTRAPSTASSSTLAPPAAQPDASRRVSGASSAASEAVKGAAAPPAAPAGGAAVVDSTRAELLKDIERLKAQRASRASLDGSLTKAPTVPSSTSSSSHTAPPSHLAAAPPAHTGSVFTPPHPAPTTSSVSRAAATPPHHHKAPPPAGTPPPSAPKAAPSDAPTAAAPPRTASTPSNSSSVAFERPPLAGADLSAQGRLGGGGVASSYVPAQEHLRASLPGGGGGGGLHADVSPAMQVMLEDALSSFRDAVRADVQNMHLDMIRQFHLQQRQTESLLEKYSAENRELREEVSRLRQETNALRNLY